MVRRGTAEKNGLAGEAGVGGGEDGGAGEGQSGASGAGCGEAEGSTKRARSPSAEHTGLLISSIFREFTMTRTIFEFP